MFAALTLLVAFAQVELKLGPVEVDRFHPDRSSQAEPRRGGAATLHVSALPPSLNAMVESSGAVRQILYELHESLVRRDPISGEYVTDLAESFDVDDRVTLASGVVLYGDVVSDGATLSLRSGASDEVRTFERDSVGAVELDTVYTFRLRGDVKWHDGHAFDGRDVLFSYECFKNPLVRCDRKRYLFDKVTRAELIDPRTVRFEFAHPYFMALSTFDESFTILPSHVYDLRDVDHAKHEATPTPQDQARLINEGPANRAWIGLGPYKLERWTGDVLETTRFDGYFDPARGGYLDRLRWRAIADNQAATNALLAGELDFFDRLSVDDYFGARTADESFTRRFYRGYFFTPSLSLTVWNTSKPNLADPRVRTALGMCFDFPGFIDGFYRGLAFRVTGEQMPFGPAYDRKLAPLAFDPRRAIDLLADAGWIDRDGDGVLDRDGVKLALGYLYPSGNEVSRTFGEAFQAQLAKIGVVLELQGRDNAALADLMRKREFDAAALALALPFESDPEQLWHSKWASSSSANRSGLRDDQVDRCIESIQRETDSKARAELFHQLQRRLYELQPVLFGVWAPRRFAMSRRLRGFEIFPLDPGYNARRWFVDAER